jgi:hypothetical protein
MKTNRGQKWYQSKAPLSPLGIFLNLRGLVPLNVKKHFSAYADKLCCSVAPQALYSDRGLWHYAITVIALVSLHCKLISPYGATINTAKGLTGFSA